MTIKVAINGFGRIGRLVARRLLEIPECNLMMVNDLVPVESLAYLFKYDSVFGTYPGEVRADGNFLHIGDKQIQVFAESDPKRLPYAEFGIKFVVESTGRFTSVEDASKHLAANANNVLVTAPSKDAPMFVMGVNHETYKPTDRVISNASCTTNCLAPVAKVLNDTFGVAEGLMTTIHAVTASQSTVDTFSPRDPRAGRSVLGNIIPASTGAAKAVGKVLPELNGKLTGMAFRVPVADVSVVDLVVRLEKGASTEEINQAIIEACDGPMAPFMGYTREPAVSTDFLGDARSSIVDLASTVAISSHFVKLVAWYANEWGYAIRVCDLMLHAAKEMVKQ